MVILLDSEAEGKMYIKVSDNIGMSSLRIFNYVEEAPVANSTKATNNDMDLSQYVRKDELNLLIKEALNEQSIQSVAEPTAVNETKSATEQPKVVYLKK